MKPVIGIPECHDETGRIRTGRDYLYNDIAYARAIDRAGGTSFHLPIQSDPVSLVARVDGLMLPGGDDFLPSDPDMDASLYCATSETQLAFDRALLRAALGRGIPILGICYGAQLLALEFGARLHYHLPDDVANALEHRLDETSGRHSVRIDSASRLARLVGQAEIDVNSLHHQAIAEPGSEIRVVATSPDGVIEAVERPGDVFCLGVQWHPEKLDDFAARALFAGFVASASEFAADQLAVGRPRE